MKRLVWVKLTLVVMLLVGFAARAYQIGSISNQFHITRQFSTAQMVRGEYFSTADVPEWRREIAFINQPLPLEPPVIQTIALIGYKLAGSEQLWIPRTFSALAWVIGGIFLFLCAKKIMREEAALVVVAFYLFTPYGIAASRSFQANPTMIALSIVSYFAILHYFEQPTTRRLIFAIIVSAAAYLVMIYTVFTIFILFGWLSIQRHGLRHAVFNRNNWLFAFFSLLPAGVYYFDGFFISGAVGSQSGTLFKPQLWSTVEYWVDWIGRIGIVVGYLPVILSIQALITARKPTQSATIRSLRLGYFVYGFIINWPITSHDYYSMPLIPIVALSLGSVADFIFVRLQAPRQRRWATALALLLVALISISGLSTYLPTTVVTPEQTRDVQTAEEIGDKLQHSSSTIFLAPNYGSLLKFYGEIAGYNWPDSWDLYAQMVSGIPSETPAKRIAEITKTAKPHYFIITDFAEFKLQKDLMSYLATHFVVLEQTPDYLIYDLTKSVSVQS